MRKLAWKVGLAGAAALACGGAAPAPEPLFVPVLRANFPDPFVLPVGRHYLAYGTNTAERNVPMAASTDLVRWQVVKDEKTPTLLHDAMPDLPSWAAKGATWAPEVMEVNGRYNLYFTARYPARNVQCVGVATSADPLGPFTSTATQPLVCQVDQGGTIDAQPFRDADGQLYLYYKNDGNNPRFLKPARIWAHKMAADGLSLTGQAVPLLRNDKPWEWRVVESPAMVRHAGGYTMLFSGNHFGWESDQVLSNYATGYARCEGPMGPCVDAKENPILFSYNKRDVGCLSGPGHPVVFTAGGRHFMAFHAWAATAACRPAERDRHMYVAPLSFNGATPVIGRSLRPASAAR